MALTLDATTEAEYEAAATAELRAKAVIDALSGTVTVKVFDGADSEKGSGTMASPWATRSGKVITIGELASFAATDSGTPDENWYLKFISGSRYVRGSFGLTGSGQAFTWSLDTWEAGQSGSLGTVTATAAGPEAPVFETAPTSASLPSTGGTIQFTASDPNGDTVVYSLTAYLDSIKIDSSGLVTVPASAAGTSGNITVSASDGLLSASATCAVTVAAVSAPSVASISFDVDPWNPPALLDWGGTLCTVDADGGNAPPNSAGHLREIRTDTPRSGARYYRCKLQRVTNEYRQEFSTGAASNGIAWCTGSTTVTPTEEWLGFSFRAPAWVADTAQDHAFQWVTGNLLDGSFYLNSATNPMLSMTAESNGLLRLRNRWCILDMDDPSRPTSGAALDAGDSLGRWGMTSLPLVSNLANEKDVWIDFVARFIFDWRLIASGGTGLIQVWKRQQGQSWPASPNVNYAGPVGCNMWSVSRGAMEVPYWKFGVYKADWSSKATSISTRTYDFDCIKRERGTNKFLTVAPT